jgi:hypothetical protein
MFSLFYYENHLKNIPISLNYISFDDWHKSCQMNKVLLELSKLYPQTRLLYNKYTQKQIGWINNNFNKHDIIYQYINTAKLNRYKINNIKLYIDNFENNAIKLSEQYNLINDFDKKKFIQILNKYKNATSNTYVIRTLLEIIKSLENDEIEIDPYQIIKLLRYNFIQIYEPQIISDIKYFRYYIN